MESPGPREAEVFARPVGVALARDDQKRFRTLRFVSALQFSKRRVNIAFVLNLEDM